MHRARLGIAPMARWHDDLVAFSDGASLHRETVFETDVKSFAIEGYDGWFVIDAKQDAKATRHLEIAIKGRVERKRVIDALGYEVVE